jgi:hypothetical protein
MLEHSISAEKTAAIPIKQRVLVRHICLEAGYIY